MASLVQQTVIPEWICPTHGAAPRGGLIACPHNHSFPIIGGIPRFVRSENYAEHFGLQWTRYRTTQLDSYTGIPISRERLRRCIGEAAWAELAGMSVLECGCGAGRFTEVLLGEGAAVTSVDLSSAAEVNADLFPVGIWHRVAQDITNLPFERGRYDLVLCLGVVQHTPNPEQTIAELCAHVRPGGWLVFDHYTTGIGRWTTVKPLFRAIMKRLSAGTALHCTERLVDIFLPLHRRFKNSRLAWTLLCRVSPITTFYHLYPLLSETLQREWALLDTHDSLTDWHKHLRTAPRILKTLQELGAIDISCEYGGNGVEARCRRPADRQN